MPIEQRPFQSENGHHQSSCIRLGDLRHSAFTASDLSDSYFGDAQFNGSDFRMAHMRDTNLRGADLRGAKWDAHTLWPEGIGPLPKERK